MTGGPVLPDWLRGPFDAVLRDMQQPHAVALEISWQPGGAGDGWDYVWFTEVGERGTAALGVTPMESAEDLKVHIADWMQDQWFPETAAAWGEARPACPGHTHPASAGIFDGRAAWYCPADGRLLAAIGEL